MQMLMLLKQNYVSKITGINNNYFTSSIESILVLFILRLSDKVFQFINNKFNKNDKNKYKLNKRIHLITNIIIKKTISNKPNPNI